MNLNKLIQLTLQNEGCSLSFNSGIFNPNVGYFSSYKDSEFKIKIEDFTEAKVRVLMIPYLIKNKELVKTNTSFIGTWVHEGLVYLDISKQFEHESACRTFTINNKQLAYYSARDKEVIKIKQLTKL